MCTPCPLAKSVSIPHKAAGRGHPFGFSGGPMADAGAMKEAPLLFRETGFKFRLEEKRGNHIFASFNTYYVLGYGLSEVGVYAQGETSPGLPGGRTVPRCQGPSCKNNKRE